MSSPLDTLINYVQITDDVGTSGQPTAEQIQDIADAGYAAVINLAMPDSDNALPDEGSLVSGAGMRYVHIPVDFANPTPRDSYIRSNIRRTISRSCPSTRLIVLDFRRRVGCGY